MGGVQAHGQINNKTVSKETNKNQEKLVNGITRTGTEDTGKYTRWLINTHTRTERDTKQRVELHDFTTLRPTVAGNGHFGAQKPFTVDERFEKNHISNQESAYQGGLRCRQDFPEGSKMRT